MQIKVIISTFRPQSNGQSPRQDCRTKVDILTYSPRRGSREASPSPAKRGGNVIHLKAVSTKGMSGRGVTLQCKRRNRRKSRGLDRAMASEEISVTKLPKSPRRVQLDVMANRLELPRIKRQLDVAIAIENHGTDGDCRPRTPCDPFAESQAFRDFQFAANRRFVGQPTRLAQPLGHKRDFPLVKRPLGFPPAFAFRGFGGVPRPFHHRLNRGGQPMSNEQGAENRVFAVINDQQEMQMIGHDHEIADGRRRPNAMNRPQGELNNFT